MVITEQNVREALKKVSFPGMSRDIVSFGFVRRITIEGDKVKVEIAISTGNPEAAEQVKREASVVVSNLAGVTRVEVDCQAKTPQAPVPSTALLPSVRRKIAIASGKGGVGKSTVAANLAVALQRSGARVGLLDADIYGPSQHMMMGCHEQPMINADEKIVPIESHGVHIMSLGFLVDPDQPVIWRGPMVMKALEQFLTDVAWGELDYLIIDLPPGTGDAQLTITQKLPLDGAVIVTTPQDVALIDARKGLLMFQKVDVPVLGVIENMSSYLCPNCGHREAIFKAGGGQRTAEALGVPFLGEIPIDAAVVISGDAGTPIVVSKPDSAVAKAFVELAAVVRRQC